MLLLFTFTMEFSSLCQNHVYENVANELSLDILALLAFHGGYVGFWSFEFSFEFGVVVVCCFITVHRSVRCDQIMRWWCSNLRQGTLCT